MQVAAELEAQHINPIAADALVLDAMLEKAFDRAHDIKNKQTELTAEQGARDAETEAAFFASILFQRDQVNTGAYRFSLDIRRLQATSEIESVLQSTHGTDDSSY